MKNYLYSYPTCLLVCSFVWVFTIWTDTYVSYYYPNVVVRDSSPETTFQHVATRLEKLAEETDSFIAIQHQDPNSEGTPVFSYTTFGNGKLPDGLQEKNLEDAQSSSVEQTILYSMET